MTHELTIPLKQHELKSVTDQFKQYGEEEAYEIKPHGDLFVVYTDGRYAKRTKYQIYYDRKSPYETNPINILKTGRGQ